MMKIGMRRRGRKMMIVALESEFYHGKLWGTASKPLMILLRELSLFIWPVSELSLTI